jgi:hypothetical protein
MTSVADEVRVEAATPANELPHIAPHRLRFHMLSASAMMLLSSVLVGSLNLIYNFIIAHKLGATGFGHATVVYTLLLLLSSVTLSFQLLCSKFVARADSGTEKVAIYHRLHRRAWLCGLAAAALLAIASGIISDYLNLPSKTLLFLLAGATAFYVPLGVRRGFMEGTYNFGFLALNFSLEAITKVLAAVVLMTVYGVEGVVGGIVASVIAAYLVAIPRGQYSGSVPDTDMRTGVGEGVQAATFFIGQVIINNVDIVLVKHFFDPATAGVYAAVALVGRVVYMLSWAVVSSMFPFSAGVRSDRSSTTLLITALLLVIAISAVLTFAAWIAPLSFWHILLGNGFPLGHMHYYSSLLALYALTTGIYAVGVVLMTYEISRRIGNLSWVQLAFSGSIVAGIYLFNSSLQEVILVQLALMMVLLLMVSVPFLRTEYALS